MPSDIIERTLFDGDSGLGLGFVTVPYEEAFSPFRGNPEMLNELGVQIDNPLISRSFAFGGQWSEKQNDLKLVIRLVAFIVEEADHPQTLPIQQIVERAIQDRASDRALSFVTQIASLRYIPIASSPPIRGVSLETIVRGSGLAGLTGAYFTTGPGDTLLMILFTGVGIVFISASQGLGRGLKERLYEWVTGRRWKDRI